jgi:hypothetical protein
MNFITNSTLKCNTAHLPPLSLLPSPFSLLPSPFSLLPSLFSLLSSLFSLLSSLFSLLSSLFLSSLFSLLPNPHSQAQNKIPFKRQKNSSCLYPPNTKWVCESTKPGRTQFPFAFINVYSPLFPLVSIK